MGLLRLRPTLTHRVPSVKCGLVAEPPRRRRGGDPEPRWVFGYPTPCAVDRVAPVAVGLNSPEREKCLLLAGPVTGSDRTAGGLEPPQPQAVRDDEDRADRHRGAGEHRVEQA